jgi:hypothetical protein
VFNEGESDFADSSDWAQRYGKVHGMKHRYFCEEKLSVELELYLKIAQEILPVITNEEVSYWKLYNCKETGLNFK